MKTTEQIIYKIIDRLEKDTRYIGNYTPINQPNDRAWTNIHFDEGEEKIYKIKVIEHKPERQR